MAKKAVMTNDGPALLETDTGEITPVEIKYETKPVQGPFWKTPWNHDTDAESLSTGLACEECGEMGKSKTQQQFLEDSKMDNIVQKFLHGGADPRALQVTQPQFMEIEHLADLQDVIVTKHQVDEAWNALPAAVRNVLRDPLVFTEYVSHCLEAGDLEPLQELGLAKPKAAEQASPPGGSTPVPPTPEGGSPSPQKAPTGA